MSPRYKYCYVQIYSSRFVTHTLYHILILCSMRCFGSAVVSVDPDLDPSVYLIADLDLGFALTLK